MFLLSEDYWEIRKTKKKGRGVFAKKDIEAGTVIGDYIGKIIRAEEEDKYEKGDHYYLMYYSDRATIYPKPSKPGIHILNHSCTPNSWMYTYRGHTLYFAIRKIFKGEELTVAYLFGPQEKDCNPCTHLCYCHGDFCTGTVHVPDNRIEKWYELEDKIAKQTKRMPIRYYKEIEPFSSYPKSIGDDSVYTLFGNTDKNPETLTVDTLPKVEDIRKVIRRTGKTIHIPTLNLHIFGVMDNYLITKEV